MSDAKAKKTHSFNETENISTQNNQFETNNATDETSDENSVKLSEIGEPKPLKKLKLMTWNIDGLSPRDLRFRYCHIATVIEDSKYDVALLQEVVAESLRHFRETLVNYEIFDTSVSGSEYFNAILIRKGEVSLDQPRQRVLSFEKSAMGRTLQRLQFKDRYFEENIPLKLYKERYRIPPEAVDYLEAKLAPLLQHPTKRSSPLTPRQQILVFCNYTGCNGFYHCVRDHFGLSTDTVFRTVHRVLDAILTLRDDLIRFPDQPMQIANEFKQIANFPSVIGCLDGTHVTVSNPPKKVEASFLNRKQTHSLSALLLCGPDLYFYYAYVNFGGRAHDSRILQESKLWATFEEEKRYPFPGSVILADQAFPLRPWLITAFNTSEGLKEKFNSSLAKTRNTIRRAIGVLKKRFYCLATGLRVKDMQVGCKIVLACVLLHNLCIRFGDDGDGFPEVDPETDREQEIDDSGSELSGPGPNDQRRQQILQYFANN